MSTFTRTKEIIVQTLKVKKYVVFYNFKIMCIKIMSFFPYVLQK